MNSSSLKAKTEGFISYWIHLCLKVALLLWKSDRVCFFKKQIFGFATLNNWKNTYMYSTCKKLLLLGKEHPCMCRQSNASSKHWFPFVLKIPRCAHHHGVQQTVWHWTNWDTLAFEALSNIFLEIGQENKGFLTWYLLSMCDWRQEGTGEYLIFSSPTAFSQLHLKSENFPPPAQETHVGNGERRGRAIPMGHVLHPLISVHFPEIYSRMVLNSPKACAGTWTCTTGSPQQEDKKFKCCNVTSFLPSKFLGTECVFLDSLASID